MTVALNSARKIRAIKITHTIQAWMDLKDFSSERCTELVRQGDYLAGLLYDSPCEQLGVVLRRALVNLDEKAANNALSALEHELTVGMS